MALHLTILYRGPLSSCNYDCSYCPFAKHHETAAELAVDRQALGRLVDWVEAWPGRGSLEDTISVFFTPWGEALSRRWYREAMIRLSHLPHTPKTAVQTNLSCSLEWLDHCHAPSVGLWCTYHPTQTTREDFLKQCRTLDEKGIRYSVGVVGLKEHFPEIEALRRELSPQTYLWINAFKETPNYYTPQQIDWLESVDWLFRHNTIRHASFGRPCRAGETVISVDGAGDVRRCHFIPERIGNVYSPDFPHCLRPRRCSNQTCGCHIGYVHLNHLNLYDVYGDGVLERIPKAAS